MNPNGTSVSVIAETTTERVAYVAFQVALGAEFTTAEIAAKCGITPRGADKLMERASRVIPIVKMESRWTRY